MLLPLLVCAQTRRTIRAEFENRPSLYKGLLKQEFPKRPRIGLVLSGGGARAVAQIGVLRVLERHRIPIDFICGTSFGAVVGGLYASGYTVAELESLALHTDWDEILSLTDEANRENLFVDQKAAYDRSFLALRFQGLTPVIPPAVSSGQRLTDFIGNLVLQAIYHPTTSFDDLRIPFRCVATDLISGTRVVIREGSLWEALRATTTVPLLFTPVERDTMQLIDGGLLSNVPVDVAREAGVDLVIAVNSTSGLRNADELKAPWQTADQIMGIMMQQANEQQLRNADVVITPPTGKHLASNFHGLDTLIQAGERIAEQQVQQIHVLYDKAWERMERRDTVRLTLPIVEIPTGAVSDSLLRSLRARGPSDTRTGNDVSRMLVSLYDTGMFQDVSAEVIRESLGARVEYHAVENPILHEVMFQGSAVLSPAELAGECVGLIGRRINFHELDAALEEVVRLYRKRGYSLARVDSALLEGTQGRLTVFLNEGVIGSIEVQGGVRARDEFVLQDFPLRVGGVFQLEEAERGIGSILGTRLFEFAYLEISYPTDAPALAIRVRERPSQLVRFGFRTDNERSVQGSIDIRDENFRGSGMELGLTFLGGGRNQDAILEYKARRIFRTSLSFGAAAFYSARNSYLYTDAPTIRENHWDRVRFGEYRDIRYGGRLVFGNLLERLGSLTVELSLQNVQIKNLENADDLEERFRLMMVRFGSMIDTKDRYPFARSGISLDMSYELALKIFGSQVSYNALKLTYESFSTWGTRHTFHPRFTLGISDRTMPLPQQFRLGGRESFFGLHEDDRYGRQLLLINLEYRYLLPIRIVFDSYFRTRLDVVTLSSIPEELKLSTLRYGLGGEIALDTPLGPAAIGVGKSFYFSKSLPENPLQEGPFLLYLVIGYQL